MAAKVLLKAFRGIEGAAVAVSHAESIYLHALAAKEAQNLPPASGPEASEVERLSSKNLDLLVDHMKVNPLSSDPY